MSSNQLCTTPTCVHIASNILNSLATNYTEIDPCTNFDHLVCGNWASWHDIPPGQASTDVISALTDDIYSAVRQIIEADYPTGPESGWVAIDWTKDQLDADKANFVKLTEAYNVCLNDSVEVEPGLDTLLTFVQDVVSAFPADLGSGDKPEDLSSAMGDTLTIFESYGIGTTQRIVMQQNNLDPNETSILVLANLDQSLPTTDEALAETYTKLAAELLSNIHPSNMTSKQAASLLEDVFKLQTRISDFATASGPEEMKRFPNNPLDALTPRNSLQDFQKDFPQLNLKHVIERLAPSGYEIETIAAPQSDYFKNLIWILVETPANVLQTYFVWTAINTLSPYVASHVTSDWDAFNLALKGQTPDNPVPNWRKCIEFVDTGVKWIAESSVPVYIGPTGLTAILTRFFIDRHYTPEVRNLTTEIAQYLHEAFLEHVDSHDWISSQVKQVVADKIHAMEDKIGFPTDPDTIDPIALQEYYAACRGEEVGSSGKPWDRGQFKYSPLSPGAYQDRQLNALNILAGMQQFPQYDVGFPSYLLYGGMGSIVGHEITHGFDSYGRHFDASGNMSEWWDTRSTAAFDNKTACFVDQYSSFTVIAADGTRFNFSGSQTLEENIADAGGVAASYRAWRNWEEENDEALSLPGLEHFTHEQLFFIKWGLNFCRNYPASVDLAKAKSDSHSPKDARIKLTLDNTAAFKEAFGCPVKEPVCELW